MPYAEIQVAASPGAATGLSKSKLGAIGLLAGPAASGAASPSSASSSTTASGSTPTSSR